LFAGIVRGQQRRKDRTASDAEDQRKRDEDAG
jgi:hypothetical protein